MGRTKGAKNRTPRELRKDGEHQIKESKLKARIAALKEENKAKKR